MVVVSVLNSVLSLCSQKELTEKQTEMVKTVTAAENAINKLQLNTVSIEVNTQVISLGVTRVSQRFIKYQLAAAILGLRTHQPVDRFP